MCSSPREEHSNEGKTVSLPHPNGFVVALPREILLIRYERRAKKDRGHPPTLILMFPRANPNSSKQQAYYSAPPVATIVRLPLNITQYTVFHSRVVTTHYTVFHPQGTPNFAPIIISTSGLDQAKAQSTLDSFLVGGELSDDDIGHSCKAERPPQKSRC